MPRAINLTGQRFGRLTAIVPTRRNGRRAWVCECACTEFVTVQPDNLRSGHTTSCGCAKRDNRASVTHGHTGSYTYDSWQSMLARIDNPKNADYPRYGGRGITVDPRWRDFAAFLADMGERPAGLTLDRIDSDGNYEPGNCRWADRAVQRRNQTRVKLSDADAADIRQRYADGETGPELARAYGVNHTTIYRVVKGKVWACQ